MSTTEWMSENLMNYRDRLEEIRADWTRSDETKKCQDLQPHTPRQEAPTAPLRGASQPQGRGR
jgi:hypothetical protein